MDHKKSYARWQAGGRKVQKIYPCKGKPFEEKKKKKKKNNARPVALESVPTMALKEFMQEKCSRKNIDAARKFPSPTIAFQIVRP